MKAIRLGVVLGLALSCGLAWALDWTAGEGFRSAELPVPPGGKTGFTLLPPAATGIHFTNALPEERFKTNQILLNGSGVAAGDVDGDGWCDLFLCRLGAPGVLYRNLGNWHFQDITAAAFPPPSTINSQTINPLTDSTGAAFADLDGDGDLDLIVNTFGRGTHVFLNDGKGHFAEWTNGPALNPGRGGMSLALGDLDGDGFLDLYVANYRTSALMDMPNTRFWIKTVNGKRVVSTVNGRPVTDPDLANRFLVNETGGIDELGEPDVLYHNQGGTNLVPVSFTGGAFLDEDGRPLATPPFEWGLTVAIRDINQDGLPDIYVCNDFDSPDRVWINQGNGRFQAIPRLAMRKVPYFSMGMDFADINRDGFDDFLVLDMLARDRVHRLTMAGDRRPYVPVVGEIENRPSYLMSMLFLNRGDGTYAEIGQLRGLEAMDWSWSAAFLDVDLDGWEDILVTNGNERESRHMDVAAQLRSMRTSRQMSPEEILNARKLFPRYATPNLAFRNRRDLTFEETGRGWGFDMVGVSNGFALADLDNDGDLDVVVNNLNSAAGIYRNDTSAPRVAVRLKGRPPNTAGIGAQIKVFGGPVTQSQQITCAGRYLSCDQPMRVFAAGALTNELTIEVLWRGGARSVVTGVKPNRIYEIAEPQLVQGSKFKVQSSRLEGSAVSGPSSVANTTDNGQRTTDSNPQSAIRNPQSAIPPLFKDFSPLLNHSHHDEPFDDFARQPLLPNKLSQLGPGVSWCDLDGDGWEDLIIGSGKGGAPAVFRNSGKGTFTRWAEAQPAGRDQTTVLGWRRAGEAVLLAGSANYEEDQSAGGCVQVFDLARKIAADLLPGQESSTGPLAMADIDGDGSLDLFVGGRVVPGKYPQAATSLLFRNVNGKFEPDAENNRRLAGVGLVSGAVFSDLDGDGDPDLVLACEWGPVRVFRNDGGKLTDATEPLGLGKFKGWWNGVTTGDFDGDGRLDIVASNWGRNTRYESHRRQPLVVFFGDLNGDGTVDLVETHYDERLQKRVPERGLDFLARALPFVREKYATHAAYAVAGVEEIFGERLATASRWEANWLESTVFLNRGEHFDARPLPVEAQMAPAFGLCVGDCDGDGLEDIFLGQNFFATQPETPRYDAGCGLWLRGDGHGGFTALTTRQSGVAVYGEQRGCALADYDHDGRVDLVVTQNGAQTKLYKNVAARPGLRVRLLGPPGNPDGIGAVLRLGFGNRLGPARELHAGAGYWSQDGAAPILGGLQSPAEVWVRWPGGKVTTAPVPPGAKEITVDPAGKIERASPR